MPKVVLSHKQFVIILYVYLLGASMLFIPEALFAGKDAWLSTIFATLTSMVLMAAWLYLQRKYPGMSLIQFGIKIMGPWIGYPFGFLLVYIMFTISTFMVEDIAGLVSIVMLPSTPSEVIRLSFILVAAYACYKGVESIARLCELAFVPMTLLIIVLPLLELGGLSVSALQPVYIVDWLGVTVGAVSALVLPFAEIFVPVMLLPFVSVDQESEKYYYLAILGAGLILLTRTLVGLMVFGPDLLNIFTFQILAIFRVIELGVFLNRVEGLFFGLWYLGLLLKFIITFYALVLALSQLIGVKRMENLWVPVAALMFFVGQTMLPMQAEFEFTWIFILPFLAVPGEILWPLALVTVEWLRGRLRPASLDKLDKGQY